MATIRHRNLRSAIVPVVWLTAMLLTACSRPLAAQDFSEGVALPGQEDRNEIGNYDFDSPYSPVPDINNYTPPREPDPIECDPLIFAPNMFGGFTRAPAMWYQTATGAPINRSATYRLFAFDGLGQSNAYYGGGPGSTTLQLDPLRSFPPLHLGSGTGPLIASPAGNTLTTVLPLDTIQPAGFPQQLLENAAVTSAAQTLALTGETMTFDPLNSVARLQLGGVTGADYFIDYTYIYTQPGVTQLTLPNPVDGGLTGRTLVSTNASPLPRDRILYDFDYLSATQLSASGANIQRNLFGFEKAFFGGLGSVTLRIPFASTIDANVVSGSAQTTNTSFGNVQVDLKSVLLMRPTWLLSGGVGISLPTASDTRLMDPTQTTTLARINNETVVLKPFIAGLWTPNQRLFAQSWMYGNFDTRGNPVQMDVSGTLTTVGRLNDAAGLGVDTQLGYWLISPCESTGWLRGFAPFGELHYITSLQNTDAVQSGSIMLVDSAGRVDELYATLGAVTQIRTNCNASVGLTLPMLRNDNRFSDWNLGLRLNYFFGGTAANRFAGARPTTY